MCSEVCSVPHVADFDDVWRSLLWFLASMSVSPNSREARLPEKQLNRSDINDIASMLRSKINDRRFDMRESENVEVSDNEWVSDDEWSL